MVVKAHAKKCCTAEEAYAKSKTVSNGAVKQSPLEHNPLASAFGSSHNPFMANEKSFLVMEWH